MQVIYEMHVPAADSATGQAKRRVAEALPIVGLICLLGSVFFLHAYRLNMAPDVHTDEFNYYRAGYNIWRYGSFSWPESGPITVHPPLYFLCEAALFSLVRHGLEDMYRGVYTARLLNDFYATLTALFLFLLARRMSGTRMAVLAVVLFMWDPFVLRTNRRSMLETMTELLILIGFYVFYISQDNFSLHRQLLCGLIWGLALLTKELAIICMTCLGTYTLISPYRTAAFRGRVCPKTNWLAGYLREIRGTLLYKRDLVRGVLISFLTSLAVWSAFPIWAFSVGEGERFIETKLSLLKRWLGFIQNTGWNRPEASFAEALARNLHQYATSYLLLGLGALVTAYLFFFKRDQVTRFILAWAGTMYAIFAFIVVRGQNNDQYFYLLIVAAIFAIAYGLDQLIGHLQISTSVWRWPVIVLLLVLFIGILGYNVWDWGRLYGWGVDNARWQLSQWVAHNIPHEETIGVSIRVTAYVQAMFPHHRVIALYNVEQTKQAGVHYVITSTKWLEYRFGDFSPEYYDWIHEYGKRLYSVYSPTPWLLEVYYLEY